MSNGSSSLEKRSSGSRRHSAPVSALSAFRKSIGNGDIGGGGGGGGDGSSSNGDLILDSRPGRRGRSRTIFAGKS